MDNDNDTLEIRSLKRIFMGLCDEQQLILVQDLMEMAGLDSICRINSIVTIAGVDMTAPDHEPPEAKDLRLYKDRFETFIMPFLSSFLRIIRRSYLNDCFEVYQLLAEKSIGGRFHGQEDVGDKFIWALTKNHRTWDHENFRNDAERIRAFREEILDPKNVRLDLVQITADYPDKYRLNIKFIALLVLLMNDPERAYIVLFMLGYLNGHRLEERIKAAFTSLCPEIIDPIKLQSLFTVKAKRDNYSCPHFPGLRYWTEIVD